jgi:hypothetical protein
MLKAQRLHNQHQRFHKHRICLHQLVTKLSKDEECMQSQMTSFSKPLIHSHILVGKYFVGDILSITKLWHKGCMAAYLLAFLRFTYTNMIFFSGG